MKYMGSKARLAKHLIPIIESKRNQGQLYVEPFVGGANMVADVLGRRLCFDSNEYLISMWSKLVGGWIPRNDYSKDEYLFCKENPEQDKALTGWVGVNCSYSGKWFGGYAGIVETKGGTRNYQNEAFRNTMLQVKKLIGVEFIHSDFNQCILQINEPSIIYCDPPYFGTTSYKDGFNHHDFYEWCDHAKDHGHTIFVSEYSMPDRFQEVWSREFNSSLSANGKVGSNKKSVEKLFLL